MAYSIRTITAGEHLDFLNGRDSASFLQTPAWAKVKTEWRNESIGWFDESGTIVGAGLVLYRQLPKIKRYLAYLPEGPVIDWESDDLGAWLTPMAKHLKKAGAFGARIGAPLVIRRWHTDTIKKAIADDDVDRLSDVKPDVLNVQAVRTHNQLRSLGWLPPKNSDGLGGAQPRFVFQLPVADRTDEELLKGMNQQWRRNIKKAAKTGVTVTRGTIDDLPAFHSVYVETAERDQFSPRPLSYFETIFEALLGEDDDRIRLYLAHHEGDLVAATTWVKVGNHTWYLHGASTTAKRDVRGSNAIQWQMIRDTRDAGASTYDMRGITEGLSADDPHLGLIQFKVGTGGEAAEYLGEWDLPLNRPLYKAFDLYMSRRGG